MNTEAESLGLSRAGTTEGPSNAESLEDHDDDEDEDGDIDEDTALGGFGNTFFNIFGQAQQPWWKGPNVCVEREEIDESTNSSNSSEANGDASSLFGSFHFSSCQQTPVSYVCRTKMSSHGIRKTFVVKYHCCYGHQRVEGKPGCVEVNMKPMMDTLVDVGVQDFVELIKTAHLEDRVKESNMTIFAPSNDAIRDFTDSFQEANLVEFHSTVGQRKKRDAQAKEESLSMRGIVLGHITPGFFDINEIVNRNEIITENNNSTIRMSVYPAAGERIITANCARVTSVNNYATNGIVHVVDRVLQPVTQTMAERLDQDEQFTTLTAMLGRAELKKKLSEPGHWTLFAFTDSAYEKLDASIRKRLKDAETCVGNLVRHHLIPHTLCSTPILNHATTLNIDGEPLHLERSEDGKLFVNKVQIVAKDIMATNGIIHVVDEVMVPESAQSVRRVLDAHNLTKFHSLLEEAGLMDVMDSSRNMTVFVPSDKALSQPEAVAEIEKRRGDQAALRDLLLFHSTGPAVQGCDLGSRKQDLKSGLADHSLRLGYYSVWPFISSSAPARVTVECARITHFDNKACGGVIHEVDRLLVPPENTWIEELRKRGNYSVFLKLIEKIGLEEDLKDDDTPLTILAPTDDAFDELESADMELLHNDTQLTSRIIKHHILPEMLCCTGVSSSSWLFVNRVETLGGQYITVRRDNDDKIHFGTTKVKQCDIITTNGIIHSVNRIMLPMKRRKNENRKPNVDILLYGL